MAYGVFIHRTDSIYDDVPSERYQFPKRYLSSAQRFEGDWIVYLEPRRVKNAKGYFAIAKVQKIKPDPKDPEMYIAIMEPGSYLDFGDPVPFSVKKVPFERGLLNGKGGLTGNKQAAVRQISTEDFTRILKHGLGKPDAFLPRVNEYELLEREQTFDHFYAHPRVQEWVSRSVRDRNFRKTVLRAYGERCAITGLRLINGGGRAEVEAAHIRPVQFNGPDIVNNGIALSGTAHWMFDRGLVGLDDDYRILVSRQANDPGAICSMIHRSGELQLPTLKSEWPRPEFVTWHRENCFKQ